MNKKNLAACVGAAALVVAAASIPLSGPGVPAPVADPPTMTLGTTASYVPVGTVLPTAATTLATPRATPAIKAGG